MVQGIFDDLNPATRSMWDYPATAPNGAGPWDPDRNTDEFVAAMKLRGASGLLGFTINLQGGALRVQQGTTVAQLGLHCLGKPPRGHYAAAAPNPR